MFPKSVTLYRERYTGGLCYLHSEPYLDAGEMWVKTEGVEYDADTRTLRHRSGKAGGNKPFEDLELVGEFEVAVHAYP